MSPRVLIVLDDPEPLAALCRQAGFAVRAAAADPSARRQAVRERPDVALVALTLGGRPALPLIEFLRHAHGDGVEVLVLAGDEPDGMIMAAVEAGATGVLPVNAAHEAIAEHVRTAAARAAAFSRSGHTTTVLVVDPDDAARRALVNDLSEMGLSCRLAANGDEARDALAGGGADMLAVAVGEGAMPGAVGDLIALARAHAAPALAVVPPGRAALQSALALGFTHVLPRPYEMRALHHAVLVALKPRRLAGDAVEAEQELARAHRARAEERFRAEHLTAELSAARAELARAKTDRARLERELIEQATGALARQEHLVTGLQEELSAAREAAAVAEERAATRIAQVTAETTARAERARSEAQSAIQWASNERTSERAAWNARIAELEAAVRSRGGEVAAAQAERTRLAGRLEEERAAALAKQEELALQFAAYASSAATAVDEARRGREAAAAEAMTAKMEASYQLEALAATASARVEEATRARDAAVETLAAVRANAAERERALAIELASAHEDAMAALAARAASERASEAAAAQMRAAEEERARTHATELSRERERIAALERERDGLEWELTAQKRANAAREAELSARLERAVAERDGAATAASTKVTELTGDLGRARGELLHQATAIDRLRAALAERNADLERLAGTFATRCAELERLRGDLTARESELESELGTLREDLRAREAELAALAGLKVELSERTAQLERMRGKLEARDARIDQLTGELGSREAELTEARKLVERARPDAALLASVQTELASRNAELARMRLHVERMSSEVDAAHAKAELAAAVERERDAALAEIERRTEMMRTLAATVERANEERRELTERIAALRAEAERTESDHAALLATVEEKLGQTQGSIHALQSERDRLAQELAGLDRRAAKTAVLSEAAAEARADLETQVAELSANLANARLTLERERTKFERILDEREEIFATRLAQFEKPPAADDTASPEFIAELAHAQAALAAAEAQVAEAARERASLTESLAEAKSGASARAAVLETALKRATREQETADERIVALEAQLAARDASAGERSSAVDALLATRERETSARVADLEAQLAARDTAADARIAALEAQLAARESGARERIASLEAQLAARDANAGERTALLEAKLATLKREAATRVGALEALLAARDANAGEFTSAIEAQFAASEREAAARIAALEAELAAHDSAAHERANALEEQLTTREHEVEKSTAALAAAQAKLRGLEEKLAQSAAAAAKVAAEVRASADERLAKQRELDATKLRKMFESTMRLKVSQLMQKQTALTAERDELAKKIETLQADVEAARASAPVAAASARPASTELSLPATGLDALPCGMALLDAQLTVLYANPLALRFLGLRQVPPPGPALDTALAPFRAGLTRALAGGRELPWQDLEDGHSPLKLRHAVRRLTDAALPAALVLLLEDDTERRRLQTYVHQADQLASLSMISSGMLPDVTAALSIAMRHAEKLAGQVGAQPELKSVAEKIQAALTKAATTTETLSGLSTTPITGASWADPRAAFDRVAAMLEDKMTSTSHRLRWDSDIRPRPVAMEQGELERLLLSLFLFACDITPTGGVISVNSADLPDLVQLRVATGRGALAEGELARIMDPFAKAGTAVKLHRLGPSIAKHMVEQAGGSIGIDVDEETGAIITIRLPAAAPLKAAAGIAADGVVLVAEGGVADACRRAFDDGTQLKIYADLEQALGALEADRPRVLVLDPRRVNRKHLAGCRAAFAAGLVPALVILRTIEDLDMLIEMPELPPHRLVPGDFKPEDLRGAIDAAAARAGRA